MISTIGMLRGLVLVAALSISCGYAQKVKVGFDKAADFSRYKSYSLQMPAAESNRPLLYASVVGSIKNEIESKGLANKESDSDLIAVVTGSMDYGMSSAAGMTSDSCKVCKTPMYDARDWQGYLEMPGPSGKPALKGSLEVTFVERTSNKAVWTGLVVQKLNEEKKEESLQKIGEAIKRLFADFPPKSK
jgi:hypothetical protein